MYFMLPTFYSPFAR